MREGVRGTGASGPMQLPHLAALIDALSDTIQPADRLLKTLGAHLERIAICAERDASDAELVGERLRVRTGLEGVSDARVAWTFRIVGEASGVQYAHLRLEVCGDGVRPAPSALGDVLQVLVNGRLATDEERCQAGMEIMWRCSVCKAPFAHYDDAITHEARAHGTSLDDAKRPDVSRGRPSARR